MTPAARPAPSRAGGSGPPPTGTPVGGRTSGARSPPGGPPAAPSPTGLPPEHPVPGRRSAIPAARSLREEPTLRLELRGITKRFGDLVANDDIDLTIEPGEIHALLGENGAGKSTLMNVLYGLLAPTGGEILVDGTVRTFRNPGDAIAAGIGMVHQHFMLVPVFTVTENIMLGAEQTSGGPLGMLNRRTARQRVAEVSGRYGLPVDPDAVIEDLSVGAQQRVEIIKALIRDVDLLILDEPTAVLTPQETEELLAVMRGLRDAGKSLVFITHKLKEVQAIADRITVIRRGRVVGTALPDASEDELASLMVGRAMQLTVERTPSSPGEPVLSVSGLTVLDERGQRAVDGVDFDVRAGEVLGIAGVQGNGQTELVESIMGLRPVLHGSVTLSGRSLVGRQPSDVLASGVGYIPEDRSEDGLVKEFSVAENLVLDMYRRPPYGSRALLYPAAIESNAAQRIEEYDVRTDSGEVAAGTLSGGNQQKVIVAREMSRPLTLFIAAQPTRGLDVGSTQFIHGRMIRERDRGTAVLLVSSELDEVQALSDRIAVMYRGRVLDIVPADTPRERLGLLMAGMTDAPTEAEHPDVSELQARAAQAATGGVTAQAATGGVTAQAATGAPAAPGTDPTPERPIDPQDQR